MIDFRYHLVSLASVLIALAVGIVLGAGPLKEGISDSLDQQVAQLRADKDALRSQLDASEKSVQEQEDFANAQLPAIVSGRLAERSVVVVTLPGAPDSLVVETEDTLSAAGASVSGPVRIEQAWSDSSQEATTQREQLASTLAPTLGLTVDTEDAPDLGDVLGALLAAPATPDGTTAPEAPSAVARAAAWTRLVSDGYVSGSLPATRANLVTVVGATQVATAQGSSGSTDPLPALADLAAALDDASDGVVIAAAIDPTAADSTSIIAAARTRAAVRRDVSSVDDASDPIGQASIVAALVEQEAGRAGQYGRAAGAKSPFPSAN